MSERRCGNCGESFQGRSTALYCSVACKAEAYNARRKRVRASLRCELCGTPFPGRGGQKYCSAVCRDVGSAREKGARRARRRNETGVIISSKWDREFRWVRGVGALLAYHGIPGRGPASLEELEAVLEGSLDESGRAPGGAAAL